MIANTAETLSKGMSVLSEHMGLIEAEKFIYLIKTEGFDYTKWQRDYFSNKTQAEMDAEMDAYFKEHPYNGNATIL